METRYRPPQATWGKRKEQMQTALRTRASNTFARDAALVSLAPGTTIGGCYQLIEMVGKGGMGVVYKARHTALNRILALKFVAPSMVSHESWQLFQQEAKLNATLSHPSLCQIYDLGIHANALPYYAMDFVDGQTLEEIIINSGPLSVGATLEIFIKVAEGLSYAHRRNVVHRDIKPANIMVQSTTGDTTEVKLLDFGIAELSEKQGKKGGQKTERIIGSAAYMSPEQFARRTTDARSDIYSLGCSIFETLTGALPFESEDFDTLDRQHSTAEPPLLSDTTNIAYPLELEAILRKCLHKSRDRRYQNASELAIDLQRILSHKELQFARPEQESLQQIQQVKTGYLPTVRIILGASFAFAAILVIALKLTEITHRAVIQQPPKSTPARASAGSTSSVSMASFSYDPLSTLNNTLEEKSTRVQLPEIKENQFFVKTINSKTTPPKRVFKFPFTASPGQLAQITPAGANSRPCMGTVDINSDNLELILANIYLDPENLLKGFRPEDLTGLDIYWREDPETKLLDAALSRFKLNTLRLNIKQWTATNLKLLNKLAPDSYLELKLNPADNSSGQPSKLAPLKNIQSLALVNCHFRLAQILATPAKMPMSTLTLSNTRLADDDVQLISKWPNLRTVKIDQPDSQVPGNYKPLSAAIQKSEASYVEGFLNNPKLTSLSVRNSALNLSKINLKNLTHPNRNLILRFDRLLLTQSNLKALKELQSIFKSITITTPPTPDNTLSPR